MLSLIALGAFRGVDEPLSDPKLRGALVCAIVSNLDGKVIFERNADIRVMPASNEKLFTCAFALAQRGPDYRSTTKFWFTKNIVKIDASGDPTLASSQLADLKAKYHVGVGHRVMISQAYKCDRPDSWQVGDVQNRFAPAVHSFTVDKGGFELRAGPRGLSFTPHTPILNRLNFTATNSPLSLRYDVIGGNLDVTGKLPASEQKIDTLSDPSPSLNLKSREINCLVRKFAEWFIILVVGEIPTIVSNSPRFVNEVVFRSDEVQRETTRRTNGIKESICRKLVLQHK